jgi:hypothetical protein
MPCSAIRIDFEVLVARALILPKPRKSPPDSATYFLLQHWRPAEDYSYRPQRHAHPPQQIKLVGVRMQLIGFEAHRRLDLVSYRTASGREGIVGRPPDSRSVSIVNQYLVHFESSARARVRTQKSEEAGHLARPYLPKNWVLEGSLWR